MDTFCPSKLQLPKLMYWRTEGRERPSVVTTDLIPPTLITTGRSSAVLESGWSECQDPGLVITSSSFVEQQNN